MKKYQKQFSQRTPLNTLENFGVLPKSKASKRHFDESSQYFNDVSFDSYENKENFFSENVKFKDMKKTEPLKLSVQFKKHNSIDLDSSISSSSQTSLALTSKSSSSGPKLNINFKSGLNKFSNAFVPSSTMPHSARHKHKNLRNLNCSETLVLTDKDIKVKDIPNEKCSKSGRIPNEMKYKTELCKNFMEGRPCPYDGRCRFAHGYTELNQKLIINTKYRSRICESYYKTMYCPYGTRCLFRHYNYDEDFIWSYYNNCLASGFLIQEINEATKLYKIFKKLRVLYKTDFPVISRRLISAADPLEHTENRHFVQVYSRLKVFQQLTEKTKDSQKIG